MGFGFEKDFPHALIVRDNCIGLHRLRSLRFLLCNLLY